MISIVLVLGLDGAYWARYVPYVYFISIMNLAYLFEKDKKKIIIPTYIIGAIIILNSLLVSYAACRTAISGARCAKSNMNEFKEYANSINGVVEIKLDEFVYQGIEYNISDLGVKFTVNQNIEATRNGFLFKY